MRIKKFKKNKYILSKDNVWVRDFCSRADCVDINNFYLKEKKICLENEFENLKKSKLEIPQLTFSNMAICSDGLDWIEKQEILGQIPNNELRIIGVNGALRNWKMVGEGAKIKRTMSYYLANNPYNECESYLPKKHNYYPGLISSIRTNPKFIEGYKNKNEIYFYKPPEDLDYSSPPNILNVYLDDYRNSICAAISLSYRFNVKNLFLFCCDEAFRDERPGAVLMENGLYQYPQQIMSQNIIDKQLYWLKQSGVKIFDHSSGIKYENAEYINSQDLISFFSKE